MLFLWPFVLFKLPWTQTHTAVSVVGIFLHQKSLSAWAVCAATCQPSGGQVLSLFKPGHTCVSVIVLTSVQPLRYTQRHALCDPALTEQTRLFIFARSLSHFTGDRHRKKVIMRRRAQCNDDENHNNSLITGSDSPVDWFGSCCRTFWLVDLELILFRGQRGRKSLSLAKTKWGR